MLLPSVFTGFDDPFFSDFFSTAAPAGRKGNYMRVDNMKTDIRELEGEYRIEMQLPGYAKEDIEVSLKDGYLTVQAHHEENKSEEEDGKFIRKECYRGSCERSFYVGDYITGDKVNAEFKDGMLKLTLPKQEALPKEEQKQLVEIL